MSLLKGTFISLIFKCMPTIVRLFFIFRFLINFIIIQYVINWILKVTNICLRNMCISLCCCYSYDPGIPV